MADNNEGRGGQRCDGVQIGTQYLRNLRKQNIARHASADSGQHAQKR